MGLEISQELITPELATEYLETNINNRNPVRGSILKYSRDMSKGNWKCTGDTIKFDENGTLIDGQNRLMAVVDSGTAIDFIVIRGLSPEAKMATDIGTPRNINHMMNFEGEKNTTTLASIGRLGLLNDRGLLGKTGNGVILSIAEILDFINENPDCRDAASFTASSMSLRTLLTPSAMGFGRFITYRIDPVASDSFFDMIDVNPASRTHPCRVLRETITNAKLKAKRGTSISGLFTVSIMAKAWNAFRENRDISLLRWVAGEPVTKFDGYPPK